MEREMIFESEHGLYYSYYKTLVEADDFRSGMKMIFNDNLTEFPSTINAVKKFNIHPEIIIGFLYQQFMNITNHFGWKTSTCWSVDRGDIEPIISCEGLGEPIYFYLEFVWYLSGMTIFLLFVYGSYLSRHILGGLSAVLYYFIVHQDATRAHTQPPARENFAFPFILWQCFYLTLAIDRFGTKFYKNFSLKKKIFQINYLMVTYLTILTTIALLFWQFSTFIFATQTFIIFGLVTCNFIPNEFAFDYCLAHLLSNTLTYYLKFGDKNYLLSLHQNMIIALMIYVSKWKFFQSAEATEQQMSKVRKFFNDLFFFISMTYFVADISDRINATKPSEDVNLLYLDFIISKFRLKQMFFSTSLYLCNPLYSYLDLETLKNFNNVFVMKFFGVLLIIFLAKWLQRRREEITETAKEKIERAKNYLLEDYLEDNRITLKDLTDPATDKKIKIQLELLKKCNYDYEKYKGEKKKIGGSEEKEKENFLSDIKRLKEQINENEKKKDGDVVEKTVETPKPPKAKRKISNEESKEKSKTPKSKNNKPKPTKEKSQKKNNKKTELKIFIQPFYLYNIIQTIIFALMAVLAMKLKYILTPFLCLIASTFPPKKWFDKTPMLFWSVCIVLMICCIADPGVTNIKNQYKSGEFTSPHLEELLKWVDKNTEKTAVFAGPMDITSVVMLVTRRPIVNHPHIEHPVMSERTKLVYSIFSKKLSSDVYNNLAKLKVQYVIMPHKDCFLPSR